MNAENACLEPNMLTIPALAERLNLSPRTVQRLIADGELPRFQIRRSTRFRFEDVLRSLRKRYLKHRKDRRVKHPAKKQQSTPKSITLTK